MRSGVLAQKVGMTRLFTEAGEHVPVTVLRLGNCQVVGHRTKEKNGYVALQLGAEQSFATPNIVPAAPTAVIFRMERSPACCMSENSADGPVT